MKSFAAAVLLGIMLITVSIMSSVKLQKITDNLYDKTDILYSRLAEKDTDGAASALDIAIKSFDDSRVIFEATGDHEEILRIETGYGNIREFIANDQIGDALAACSEVKLLLNHLTGNSRIKAENIL